MARHNVIYIEASYTSDIPLGLACTRHGFNTRALHFNFFRKVLTSFNSLFRHRFYGTTTNFASPPLLHLLSTRFASSTF